MTSYIHIASGEYPLTLDTLRRRHPNTSWADPPNAAALAAFGYARVERDPAPTTTAHQIATQQPPKLVGGVWRVTWTVSDTSLTAVKQAIKSTVTAKRDEALAKGVWHNNTLWDTDKASYDAMNTVLTGAQVYEEFHGPGSFKTMWKAKDRHVELTIPSLKMAGMAVGIYFQLCFQREAQLWAAIDAAGTAQAVSAININLGWPDNTDPLLG